MCTFGTSTTTKTGVDAISAGCGARTGTTRAHGTRLLSNPDKVLFPADGITKADLAAYYEAVAPAMLPHVRARPLNLWRWNAGIEPPARRPAGDPEGRARVGGAGRGAAPARRDGHARDGRRRRHAALAGQVNCITPHVWTSRADRLDRPDRMIFDLDPPDEGADFDHIREGALAMGELLRELGREPYAMTSGSRGIHVIAPLRRTAVHDDVRERAREIGEELAARHPDRLTTEWRKTKREGRILIDTARNTYAQTTVAPYAVRARPGAPVATPLRWEELEDPRLRADAYTLATIPGAARARRRSLGGDRAGVESPARMFRRRRAHTDPGTAPDFGVRVVSVVRDDEPAPPSAEDAWRELRAIVAEAVIWQDEAEELLAAISRREPLAELAPRGGPLIRSFCRLRARLPESDDPELRRITDVLGPVFDHHALMLSSSLDMLAVDWRSERLVEELERISGLGAPAARLEGIRAELVAAG